MSRMFEVKVPCDIYEAIRQYERAIIERALMMSNEQIAEAGRLLRMKRTTLKFRMSKLGIISKTEKKNKTPTV